MAFDLTKLKEMHDAAYDRGQVTRDQASSDLVFYWISQWMDNWLNESSLSFKGEFNILRKAGRQITSDLSSNPVQVDFSPVDPDDDNGADLVDGLYRASCRNNISKEAFDTASTEAIVCGVGGWELTNEYQTSRAGERNQTIVRIPLYEANNCVFWDPNANRLDKSDADYVSILTRYSEQGYIDLVKDLTGEDVKFSSANFKEPNVDYSFPWVAEESYVWVARFFHRAKVKTKSYVLEDLFGNTATFAETQVKGELQSLIDAGYTMVEEREYEQYEVTRYIASGEQILEETVVPGTEIPVVPEYGERAHVEGQEHYEGVTRLAKDPQRLRNFQMSYLADIVSRSPRPKPVWLAEQLQGFEHMHEESGADNNYPYLLQNRLSADGSDLPLGNVGVTPEQPMPIALAQSIELSRQAVEDVANPGIPQDIADSDLSGKAVSALQNRLDQQSAIYQDHHKHALRRDGEIFASMARTVYDVPRKVSVTLPDGSTKSMAIMEQHWDADTGMMQTLNDLSNSEFLVYAEIGPSFSSKKDQTREELQTMVNAMPPGDPMRNLMLLKYVELMEGIQMDDVRDYATEQLIMMGVKEPETEEQKAKLEQQQQQGQQGDPAMMLAAQAEMGKAQADQQNAQTKQMATQIDQFEAQTDRMKVQMEAEIAGVELKIKGGVATAEIDKKKAETMAKRAEMAGKVAEMSAPEVAEKPQQKVVRYNPKTGAFG